MQLKNSMDIQSLTIVEARRALDAKEYSARNLAEAYLKAIEEKNPELNAYLEVYDDVLEQADKADARTQAGESTPLLGIPLQLRTTFLCTAR